jgi:cell division protein FtsZ
MKPMAISLTAPRSTELKPRIVVFGVGGAGGNAVNNMIEAGLEGVEFVVANTDAQQLAFSRTDRRIQLGVTITQGLGAGAHPEVGSSAAEESIPEIDEQLEGAHMVFITAGMGGGTGTGAAPIIARAARERGILTVGVVTKPFMFEGRHRARLADAGVSDLQRYVDTLIVIPNQNLFRVANEKTTFADAFAMADQVLHSGVRSITDLMVLPGLINLDFADVRTVMTEMGKAMMGTGEAGGEDRALMAAQNAIQNPLLDEVSLKGAKAVLVNVTGGHDMTLLEVDEAANSISSEVDEDANIIFGAAFDPSLDGKIRVSVVATGMDNSSAHAIPSVAAAPAQRTPVLSTRPQAAPQRPAAAPPEPTIMDVAAPAESRSFVDAEFEPHAARVEAPTQPPASENRISASTIRIVDPAVDEQPEDLFLGREPKPAERGPTISPPRYASAPAVETRRPAPSNPLPDPRATPEKRSGGFLSLFGGRPRYEPSRPPPVPPAPSRSAGGAAAARAPEPAPEPEADEDLDIPSFLRRLAN